MQAWLTALTIIVVAGLASASGYQLGERDTRDALSNGGSAARKVMQRAESDLPAEVERLGEKADGPTVTVTSITCIPVEEPRGECVIAFDYRDADGKIEHNTLGADLTLDVERGSYFYRLVGDLPADPVLADAP